MELRPHQQRLISQNPRKAILAWEMRTGKSLPASVWVDMTCRAGNTFIITPKQNIKDWEKLKTQARILTKEQFKKTDIINPTAVVVDEAHYFASGLFTKQRSQLSTALYELVRKYPEMDILLLTATPV